jgi:MFS family permease
MIFTLPFAGKLMSRKNAKWYLFCSVAVLCASFAAMSQFTNVYQWYIGAVMMGLSSSVCLYLPVPMLINNWFKKKVGMAMGIALAMSGVGGAIFNPLGAWVIQNYGWRSAYLLIGSCAAVITLPFILFAVYFKPSEKNLKKYGEDDEFVTAKASTPVELTGLTSGEALKKSAFYFTVLFSGLLIMGVSVSSFLPSYVVSIGLPAVTGGFTLSVVAIGAIFGKIALGNMNDRLGVFKTTTIGTIMGCVGLVTILFGGAKIPLLYAGSILFGCSVFAMFTVEVPMIVRHFFGQKGYGAIYSFVQSPTTLCQAVVMPVYGIVYDKTNSYANCLIVSIAFVAVSFVMFLMASATGKNLYEKKETA